MLHLLQPTDPAWVDAAAADVDGLLADHAHCELKAAQSALAIVGRFADEAPEIVEPLCDLAREETQHFRQVHQRIRDRGQHAEGASDEPGIGKPEPDAYVNALRNTARAQRPVAPILLDRLLVSAMIEARSCERFKLLADHFPDGGLRTFYRGLMEAEARHFTLFRGLAEARYGAEARRRLARLAEAEAEIAESLPLGPQVHG